MKSRRVLLLAVLLLTARSSPAAGPSSRAPRVDGPEPLAEYFRAETDRLARRCLADIHSLADWEAQRHTLRAQAWNMLGLAPMPPRTNLKPVITGRIEHEALSVENLHFQSVPGLYVTANLYLPKQPAKPAPTILYVCGHGPVISNKVSYGNKVSYQHHGAWFARNGYVCMVVDTVQWGEILGVHHGTYRDGMWWWNSRGYTPAGVEAWSAIRALDYLSTRSEVDTNRFGITGRSGGGAYSWFAAALDERIKVIAPVAGITDLQNHVVDGAVAGHCDCMFLVNTWRWDYPALAALAAPRPLLLVNTDADTIFPLDGVLRTHAKVKSIYGLCRASNHFGLVIAPGPHKDTQDLQVPVFRWFNKHLKGEDPVIEMAATKLFKPEQLKVFGEIPADAINTNIHHTFVPRAPQPPVPASAEAWRVQRDQWLTALREKTFAGWPNDAHPAELVKKTSVERNGLLWQTFDFDSQPSVRLRLYTLQNASLLKPERLTLTVMGYPTPSGTSFSQGESSAGPDNHFTFPCWLAALRSEFESELGEELAATTPASTANREAFLALREQLQTNRTVLAWLAPRGAGLTVWKGDNRHQLHLRRRFMLLGQTLDAMRAWDIRRGTQAMRLAKEWHALPMTLQAEGDLACDALYASLFEPGITELNLWRLPASHDAGPDFLNVLRSLDVPQALAMVVERSPVRLHESDPRRWAFSQSVAAALRWPAGRLEFVE